MSNGNEWDEVIVPNVPLLTAVEKISQMSFLQRFGAEAAVTFLNQNAFDSHKAFDFLWGYKDRIITLCKNLLYPDLPESFGMIQNVCMLKIFSFVLSVSHFKYNQYRCLQFKQYKNGLMLSLRSPYYLPTLFIHIHCKSL